MIKIRMMLKANGSMFLDIPNPEGVLVSSSYYEIDKAVKVSW
jgi:hypothetical protein